MGHLKDILARFVSIAQVSTEQQAVVSVIIYRMDEAFQSVKILMDMFHKHQFLYFCIFNILCSYLEEKKVL